MESVHRLLKITDSVTTITDDRISKIHGITRRSRMLALNAAIEAHHFGSAGRGFAVVADEVKAISAEIANLASSLQVELRGSLGNMGDCVDELSTEVRNVRGARLADLAHNAIEVADRNLYERSCDVRWWATDGAVVDCVAEPSKEKADFATHRLAVILNSYTVYLDLWVADVSGTIVATGRPDRYSKPIGQDVSNEQWFREAMCTRDGSCFAVADIRVEPLLNDATVATYSTAIRENGDASGKILGVLGIFFDWEAQAQCIVKGVRLTDEEWARTRCLLIDSQQRVIASSDGKGILTETFPLNTSGLIQGSYEANGAFIGYALTPGYETYAGLGWYGVIVQKT